MCDRHAYFFGLDPKNPLHPGHERAIEARVKGSWRVYCGHCSVSLMGHVEDPIGYVTVIRWTHDGSSFFGRFEIHESQL